MSAVTPFQRKSGGEKTFRVELILPDGGKRRRWAVVVRLPDGSCQLHTRRNRREALWLSTILQEVEAKRQAELQAIEKHPLGALLLSITIPDLERISRIVEGTLRLRQAL